MSVLFGTTKAGRSNTIRAQQPSCCGCATSAPPLRHLSSRIAAASYCDLAGVPNIHAPPFKFKRCKEMAQKMGGAGLEGFCRSESHRSTRRWRVVDTAMCDDAIARCRSSGASRSPGHATACAARRRGLAREMHACSARWEPRVGVLFSRWLFSSQRIAPIITLEDSVWHAGIARGPPDHVRNWQSDRETASRLMDQPSETICLRNTS
jgi:hypothetical protein